ncbi:MAG TPA: patatin-like phospholipase family protein [Casimicrobiaceae bacterium]|nr:patatin-like phospholipase family protein [Casimicrobiaceae bacterium]
MLDAPALTGLILTGGGARAAYQVGVLRAVAEVLPRSERNPFPIICGTSAGAINAAALAANADRFRFAVSELLSVWRNFDPGHVYRADPMGMIKTGARWLLALMLGGHGPDKPASLLDNAPLRRLLGERIGLDAIVRNIERGDLYALAINATGYTYGRSVTFFEANPAAEKWERARRIGIATRLRVDHLLASSAIPLVFPAVCIDNEYFGDGSMRQVAPLSPALHLGAERVLVIAVGRFTSEPERYRAGPPAYPTIAQIGGHALTSIFLDSLEMDLERMQRINRTLSLIPPDRRRNGEMRLRPIETLVITPSEEIDEIAARYADHLPRSVRIFLGGIGATRRSGATLLSYLLFDRDYCRALIRLGYHDAMARREELAMFVRGTPARPPLYGAV